MRKLLDIAMAVVGNPRILLLDEIHKYQIENHGYITVLQMPKEKNITKYWKPEIKTFSLVD